MDLRYRAVILLAHVHPLLLLPTRFERITQGEGHMDLAGNQLMWLVTGA